jgi:hypothetical protein
LPFLFHISGGTELAMTFSGNFSEINAEILEKSKKMDFDRLYCKTPFFKF